MDERLSGLVRFRVWLANRLLDLGLTRAALAIIPQLEHDKPGALTKIAQLVADARTELKRLGIATAGKRSDELLNMAREQRTKYRKPE